MGWSGGEHISCYQEYGLIQSAGESRCRPVEREDKTGLSQSLSVSRSDQSSMATNSVRRIFMDATKEQHKIMAAATASTQNCSCNSWSSTSSSSNPPVTMMARYVREADKSGSWNNDKKPS